MEIAVIVTIIGIVVTIVSIYFTIRYSKRKPEKVEVPPQEPDSPLLKISIAKLPVTEVLLLGRDEKLDLLDSTWQDEKTNILSFVAWGGAGKSALVNYWLTHRMAPDNYRGARRVFGWSFYSQGTREDRQASSDEFLVQALEWFGAPETAQSKKGPWEKALRLAELIQQYKTLLILDGLEPLQYPPGPMAGRLKDSGLQALLRQLSAHNPGLCIITTREKVEDINDAAGSTLKRIFLENLSTEAGIELLKNLGVKGTYKELKAAVEQFAGHALALNLLGSFLSTVHDGDIRKRDLIPRLTEEEQKGGHAKRVMASYEIWLKDTPELNILYIMGLFDRPAPGGAIDALRSAPAIAGLTDNLQNLSDTKWKFAVKRLRDLRLLAKQDKDNPDTLDCHPLVREHFGERLQEKNPSAWQQAHERLYEYYKNLPEKDLPDTLEEMQPLFAAVNHGCQAGQYTQTWEEVYWKRIKRGNEHYSTAILGAFGSDLSALAGFFDIPWSNPSSELSVHRQALVLSLAGFRLRALGRLKEAIQPIEAGMKASISQEDWVDAAQDAGNLSELYLTLGNITKSIDFAEDSVKYSDQSVKLEQKIVERTALADALHQSGKNKEAEKLFLQAEQMQTQHQPEYPYLYSIRGFKFCDLLLTKGQYQDVRKRVSKTLEWAKQQTLVAPLEIALDNLSLGRAHLLQAQKEKTGDFNQAADYLNQSVDGLRKAGQQDDLPRGLLARAALYRLKKVFDKAHTDLDEVKEISERDKQGVMKLYLTDYYLESARLCLAEGDKTAEATEHLAAAESLITETGYLRRSPELQALKSQIPS